MRFSFFILCIIIFSGHAAGRIFYTEAGLIRNAADSLVLAGDSRPGDSLKIYAAEVRCSMPDAAVARHRMASWRLSWPSGQSVSLMFDNCGHTDGTDRPVAIIMADNGRGETSRTAVYSGLDFHGGANTLCVEWRDGTASIFAGKNRLRGVAAIPMPCPRGNCNVSATSKATLVDAAVEIVCAPQLQSGLSADSISAYFAAAATGNLTLHPLEGIWEYMDRDTDPALAIEGGRYRIAIIGLGNNRLSIIYLGGAVTNATSWHPGMIKGTITDIGFADHFKLGWIDAMQEPMDADCYATLLTGSVLSFSFPLHSATLRFRRIRESD